jgi:hypothetical protein
VVVVVLVVIAAVVVVVVVVVVLLYLTFSFHIEEGSSVKLCLKYPVTMYLTTPLIFIDKRDEEMLCFHVICLFNVTEAISRY